MKNRVFSVFLTLALLYSTSVNGVTVGVGDSLAGSSPVEFRGQGSDPDPDLDPDPDDLPKSMKAKRAESSPSIDGSLTESMWQGANWISDFMQKEPDQGAEPTLRTEVAVLYDDHAVYIGARMFSDDPDEIAALLTRRDDGGNAERLVVSLDTYGDRRTAYSFAVTAAGVRLDWYHPEDNEFNRDQTFNPVWQARTAIGGEGWTAEMRIPFSQLRFSDGENQRWGINVNRFIPTRNENVFWVVVPRQETGWASRFGELEGIEQIPSSSRIELMPYVASETRLMSDGLVDADDPFNDGSSMEARAGLDFRMGLGSNLTLDATVNPDFGQVEADPAEVNLSAFETFFDEQRPFFTQGQQTLDGVGPDYYYSRRIGAPPHLEPDADFVSTPPATTILGAAKLTGQLPSGLTIGAMAAITDDEKAQTFDLASDEMHEIDVEPLTTYAITRLQQQFGPNASTVGATLTAVNRGIEDGHPLAAELVSAAYSGGVDFNKRFEDGWYELLGHAGFSHVSGDEAAILGIQEASAHYFQRPDQDHVELDPSRTSLNGWSAAFRGGKRSGRLRWSHGVWMDSPGFEINDAGRLGRADDIAAWANLSYRQTEPGPVFRNWDVGVWTNPRWNFDGVQHQETVGFWTNTTLKNFWSTNIEGRRSFQSQSDTQTRGGPLMKNPSSWWLSTSLFSNAANDTRWGLETDLNGDELGSWGYGIRARFSTRMNDRLSLSVGPRFSRRSNVRQYIDTFDGGNDATFGERYVFGEILRSEIAAPLRVNYSFSPDLSLDLYAEPFASSGKYSGVGELARARDFDLRVYGTDGTGTTRNDDGDIEVVDGDDSFSIDNPDFDVLSFRSNLVLRWEWRPGSTFFLTWQQNRSSDSSRGQSVGFGELFDSFSADGENVLAAKFSYWLPL
jgi:hypothetical protein